MTRPSPVVTCVCGCGRHGRHHARGLIEACWKRAYRAGVLDRYPRTLPDPRPQVMSLVSVTTRGRLEDYIELTRVWGVSREEAAARVGVTERTVRRYEAHLRATAQTSQKERRSA